MHRYRIPLPGRVLELLGPGDPDAILDEPETERRFHAEDEHLPYWARPWAASIMLAAHVMQHHRALPPEYSNPVGDEGVAAPAADVAGSNCGTPSAWPAGTARLSMPARRALDLGCGLGLAGLAAAAAGWRVLLTDYEPAALDFARASAEANGLAERTEFARLDWRTPPDPAGYGMLLGADVLFEARWVEPIAEIARRFAAAGATALICDPNRRTAEGFADALSRRGVTPIRHAAVCVDFDNASVGGTLYEIRAQ